MDLGMTATRRNRMGVLIALFAVIAIPISGCGPARGTIGTATESRMTSPVAGSPLPSAAAGYKTYVSASLYYSLEYPATWFDVGGNHDGSFYAEDLVSKDIRSPIQLREDDIWLTVTVNVKPSKPCSVPPTETSKMTEVRVLLDGVPTSAYISPLPDPNFRGGDGLTGLVGPILLHKEWCYGFSFLTTSVDNTYRHLPEINHNFSSFRFNR